MHYLANIDGVDHEVEVEDLATGGLRLRLGEQEFEVDLRRVGAGSYSVLLGDRVYDFQVSHENEQFVLASRRSVSRITILDQAHRRRAAGAGAQSGGRIELKAMMPGRVVTLLITPGDEVLADQGVLTIEAMKMENELKAPRAGKLVEIKVVAGQTVEKGEVLAIIE